MTWFDKPAKPGRTGHELMIHVPMEPKNSRLDPGPDVLRTDMNVHTLKAKLDDILGRFPGYVGINNHMGSRFTTDSHAITVVITELKRHGVAVARFPHRPRDRRPLPGAPVRRAVRGTADLSG